MEKQKTNTWLNDYKERFFSTYEGLPLPKWNRIGYSPVDLPMKVEDSSFEVSYSKEKDGDNIEIESLSKKLSEDGSVGEFLEVGVEFGVGEKFVSMAEAMFNTGVFIRVPKNKKVVSPVQITFKPSDQNPTVIDQNVIIVERNSEVTFLLDYTSDSVKGAFHNGVTKIYVGENASVRLTKLQRMNDDATNFDSNVIFVESNGRFSLNHVEMGSAVSGVHYATHMEGRASELDLNAIYLLDKERKMDLGFAMNHNNQDTRSKLEVFGTMKDSSKKVFRGDLKFKKGAKRSKGAESESVVLIGNKVKAHAIPALFCKEDDVEGQHAASIGKIDENKLFYLMSRGLSEDEARKTLVEASFSPVIDKLPSKNIQNWVSKEIRSRI
jgi:Fe-S cluster assembly protein SufD